MKVNPFTDSIQDIVKEPSWQKLRQSFVGTWSTPENKKRNVQALRKWLGDMKDPRKVRIVLNYLTGSAFRIGIVSSPHIDKLLKEVRIRWADLKSEYLKSQQ